MMRSKGVRDKDRASSVLGTSIPTANAHKTAKMTIPLWCSFTLNNILLTKGSELWYKGEILQDERSSKCELTKRKLVGLTGRKQILHKRWAR